MRTTGALFPLLLAVDLGRLAREAPDLLERLVAAEQEAAEAGNSRPCGSYAVFRKRGSSYGGRLLASGGVPR